MRGFLWLLLSALAVSAHDDRAVHVATYSGANSWPPFYIEWQVTAERLHTQLTTTSTTTPSFLAIGFSHDSAVPVIAGWNGTCWTGRGKFEQQQITDLELLRLPQDQIECTFGGKWLNVSRTTARIEALNWNAVDPSGRSIAVHIASGSNATTSNL
jgi:hypothetical protein